MGAAMKQYGKGRILGAMMLGIVLTGLSACGFQLRGANTAQLLDVDSIYIEQRGASGLATMLRRQLREQDITVANSAAEAGMVIFLSGEAFDRRVLSVDARTGKVREYEIAHRFNLRAERHGEALLAEESLTQVRDYVFDENSVLGTYSQEHVLNREMQEEGARAVMRRVEAAAKSAG